MPDVSIVGQVEVLRERLRQMPDVLERAVVAFARVEALWRQRLGGGWVPPDGSPFPWAQVRISLQNLLVGFAEPLSELPIVRPAKSVVVALILAGNTPLLAWPALFYALTAGCTVYVKMSRDETLWTRLFVEALAEVDPALASLIHLDVWPGEDPRTGELLGAADVVIAYGGDTAIAALRTLVPAGIPFFGFGHAISIGVWAYEEPLDRASIIWRGFARDTLMYGQGGCLSLHALYVGHEESTSPIPAVVDALADAFPGVAEELEVPPVTDPAIARTVREARDLALFEGAIVRGADDLRWTIVGYPTTRSLPFPGGHCVLPVIPVQNFATDLPLSLGAMGDKVSSVAWLRSQDLQAAFSWMQGRALLYAVPGGMQCPPLDWKNGGVDLEAELRQIAAGGTRDTRSPTGL